MPAGTVHAIVGENGAGKSTLVNILYGRTARDSGVIRIGGAPVALASPADAMRRGIALVAQHTSLIPRLSVLDNILLGQEPARLGILQRRQAQRRAEEIAHKLSCSLPWREPAGALSVASAQKAEIVKALYRGARILMLDEPTATLAPQEAAALFDVVRALRNEGCTVLFITHKLSEVMHHSDAVTVLRGGRVAGSSPTRETSAESLLAMMLGGAQAPHSGERPTRQSETARLRLDAVTVLNDRKAEAVRAVSLALHAGEILGIAGVDGSGQRELAEAVVGLRPAASGRVLIDETDVRPYSAAARMAEGLAYVPEDRLRGGIVPAMSVAENLLLAHRHDRAFGGGPVLNLKVVRARAGAAIAEHEIRAPGPETPVAELSGGNQQKVLLARALEGKPRLLVVMQPTRGLDVRAADAIHRELREAAARGSAVLLFSLDLDELLSLSTRVAVMYDGTVAGEMPAAEATAEAVGRLMVGAPA